LLPQRPVLLGPASAAYSGQIIGRGRGDQGLVLDQMEPTTSFHLFTFSFGLRATQLSWLPVDDWRPKFGRTSENIS